MKLKQWLYGAAALAMLAACSDKDVAPGNDPGENGGSTEAVSGYLAVEIKLPEDNGTRAEDEGSKNDNFDDGTENEYKVTNALIAIFKGANERDAKFVRGQILTKPFFTNDPANDNITSSYLAAIQVQSEVQEGDKFWALVMLNSDIVDEEYTDVALNEFTLGNVEVKEGTTFSEIQNAVVDDSKGMDSFVKKNGNNYSKFFMTNAPVSNVVGNTETITTSDNIQYLTNIGSTLYDTAEEAKEKVQACVYVERAVAKLTCKKLDASNIQLTFANEDGEVSTDDWTIKADVKYALSNTPYESYVVRNVEMAEDNHFRWTFSNNKRPRMISMLPMPALGNPFHPESRDVFRTYWCQDPHYSKDLTSKKMIANADELVDISYPLYCKENTFTVANQNYKNTNIAIFEVNLSIEDGAGNAITNLYVKDGNTSKVYYRKKDAYADGITRIIKSVKLQEILKKCVKEGATLTDDKLSNIGQYLSFDYNIDANPNVKMLEISKINLVPDGTYFDEGSKTMFENELGSPSNKQSIHYEILTSVNALSDVAVYHDGKSYYAIPIKHFGDYYTPWGKDAEGNDIKGMNTKEVYNQGADTWSADHAKLYLGRYGMVRNNWYELSINKITALGSQTIPNVDIDLSDDNNEDKKYFAVEIHVLSWAKRTQNVEF